MNQYIGEEEEEEEELMWSIGGSNQHPRGSLGGSILTSGREKGSPMLS